MNSKLFKLHIADFIKGAIVAALTAGATALAQYLNVGHIPTAAEGKVILISSASALVAYLIKNFFTNSNGQIGEPEKK